MQFHCKLRIFFLPSCLFSLAISSNFQQFGFTVGIQFFHFWKDSERLVRISPQMSNGLCKRSTGSTQGLPMRRTFPFIRLSFFGHNPLTHNRFTDDQSRTALLLPGLDKSPPDCICIITVYFKDIPSPCPVFGGSIFLSYGIGIGR